MGFDLDDLSTATLFDDAVGPGRDVSRKRGASVGRYVLERELGAGGMGEVWAAWDPQLEREIAIKFMRHVAHEIDRVRLLREAQAMARITHPNIVVVHDVGEVEGSLFVAMELVRGQTLRSWAQATPRAWSTIVTVYVEAARGLAAAHEIGLIHRDFKPDNAMIEDETGRVRVMDFGLAAITEGRDRAVTVEQPSERPLRNSSGALRLDLTEASVVIGTPAYMSSEQLAGERGGPATDQFSLCVALWEALFGERPFPGANMDELERSILTRERRPVPAEARVPDRIIRALVRGLDPEPSLRWPSILALIAELEGVERRKRRRRRAALGAVALVGLVGGGAGLHSWFIDRELAACEARGERVETVWNVATRAQLEASLARAGSYGAEASERVSEALDAWTTRWAAVASAACEHTDGVPEALAVAQALCLERGHEALEQTVALLVQEDADGELATRAVELARALPDPSRCAEALTLVAVERERGAAGSPEQLEALRRELDRAELLGRAGRWDAVVEALTPLRDDPELAGARSLEAELAAALGWASYQRRDSEAAIEQLTHAYELALGAGEDELAAEVAIDLMFAHTRGVARLDEARAWDLQVRALHERTEAGPEQQASRLAALGYILEQDGDFTGARDHYTQAAALLERAEGEASLRRARLLDDLGAVHVTLGEIETGRALELESSRVLAELLGPTHPDLASVNYKLGSAAFAAGEIAEARAHFTRSVEIAEITLGPDAALALAASTGLGAAALTEADYAGARQVFEGVLRAGERRFGSDHLELVPPLINLCIADLELGALDQAEAGCARALAILEAAHGLDHPSLIAALDNLGDARARRGDASGAREVYRRSLAIGVASFGTEHPELDYARIGLGRAAWELGETDEARAQFEAVLAGRGAEGKQPGLLARAQLGLAKLDRAAGREAEATAHGQRARADLLAAPSVDRAALEEIDAWLTSKP